MPSYYWMFDGSLLCRNHDFSPFQNEKLTSYIGHNMTSWLDIVNTNQNICERWSDTSYVFVLKKDSST